MLEGDYSQYQEKHVQTTLAANNLIQKLNMNPGVVMEDIPAGFDSTTVLLELIKELEDQSERLGNELALKR